MIWILFLSNVASAWTHLGTNVRGWSSPSIVFNVNPTNCALSEQALYDVIDRSLNAWNGVATSGLRLSRNPVASSTTVAQFLAGTATDAPVIVCDTNMSGRGVDPDSIPGYMTGLATNSSGNVIYAGIVLNSESGGDASIGNLTAAETSITLAHEIGHALGLGHSGVAEALMFYSISGKPDAIITEDDIDAITAVYPKSDFAGSPMGCSAIHDTNTARDQLPELAFLAVFFAAMLILVRVVLKAF